MLYKRALWTPSAMGTVEPAKHPFITGIVRRKIVPVAGGAHIPFMPVRLRVVAPTNAPPRSVLKAMKHGLRPCDAMAAWIREWLNSDAHDCIQATAYILNLMSRKCVWKSSKDVVAGMTRKSLRALVGFLTRMSKTMADLRLVTHVLAEGDTERTVQFATADALLFMNAMAFADNGRVWLRVVSPSVFAKWLLASEALFGAFYPDNTGPYMRRVCPCVDALAQKIFKASVPGKGCRPSVEGLGLSLHVAKLLRLPPFDPMAVYVLQVLARHCRGGTAAAELEVATVCMKHVGSLRLSKSSTVRDAVDDLLTSCTTVAMGDDAVKMKVLSVLLPRLRSVMGAKRTRAWLWRVATACSDFKQQKEGLDLLEQAGHLLCGVASVKDVDEEEDADILRTYRSVDAVMAGNLFVARLNAFSKLMSKDSLARWMDALCALSSMSAASGSPLQPLWDLQPGNQYTKAQAQAIVQCLQPSVPSGAHSHVLAEWQYLSV